MYRGEITYMGISHYFGSDDSVFFSADPNGSEPQNQVADPRIRAVKSVTDPRIQMAEKWFADSRIQRIKLRFSCKLYQKSIKRYLFLKKIVQKAKNILRIHGSKQNFRLRIHGSKRQKRLADSRIQRPKKISWIRGSAKKKTLSGGTPLTINVKHLIEGLYRAQI